MRTHHRWLVLAFGLLTLIGCGYRAQVRGVLGPDPHPSAAPGSRICVKADPRAEPTELLAVVGRKIEALLTGQGYEVTKESQAQYLLLYDFERRSILGRSRFQPMSGPTSGIQSTKVESPFDQALTLRLVRAASFADLGMSHYLWAGGAILQDAPTESSRFVDLLLIAALEEFPLETEKTLDVRLSLSDERAKQLHEVR